MDAFCGRVPSFETIAMIQYICLRAPSRSLALLRSANCLSFSQFMKSKVAALLTLLGVLLAGSPAQATSILLDFGSTTVLPADELKSPAHAIGAVPASEITWNKIFIDTNTIYYGDNTLATGVTVDLGRSLVNSDTIDFNDNGFTVSALGGTINTGVYANTSPVHSGAD